MSETLQIYAQSGPHDRAFICGTKEDLINLRDVLNILLQRDLSKVSYDTFTSDGEGYTLRIIKLEENDFYDLQLPYTSDIFSEENSKTKKHPWYYEIGEKSTTRNPQS